MSVHHSVIKSKMLYAISLFPSENCSFLNIPAMKNERQVNFSLSKGKIAVSVTSPSFSRLSEKNRIA